MCNDNAPRPEAFDVGPRGGIRYVVAYSDGQPVAVFLMIGNVSHETEIHFAMGPGMRWRSEEIGRAFVAWVWRNTSIDRLIGRVPTYNKIALRLAKRVGFRDYGDRIYCAGKKHGKNFDLIELILECEQMQAVA